jgi:DNA-binding CsgD family transcriptional regulator
VQWGAGSLEDMREILAADAPLTPASGPGARGLKVFHALRRLYDGEPAGDVAAMALDAVADGSLVEGDDGLFVVTAMLVLTCCEREEVLDLRHAALEQAHRVGSPFGVLAVRLWGGFSDLRRGELVDAEASLREAAAEMERWSGVSGGSVFCAALLAATLVERGDLAGARAVLEHTDEDVGRSDEGARWHRRALQDLLLAEGQPEAVLAAAAAPLAHGGWTDNPACATSRAPRALALDRLGRRPEALALAEEDVELARRFGAPGTIGRALLVRGTVRRDEGREDLEEAAGALAASPDRLGHARALAALGALLRRSRRPTDAREPLRQALELADACGAVALAEAVRTELHATGVRPRTAALSGVRSLTASERRVAELAAGGATNREIAQGLFVTPKTVEVHLSSAYRKLGIPSRRELPGVLAAAQT